VALTVAPDAPLGWREMALATSNGSVPFVAASVARFYVGAAVPTLESIEPILGSQGTVHTLIIRGRDLHDAIAVTATPADGIRFAFPIVIDPDGRRLTVPFEIAADAPLGARVIRVTTPAATSSEAAVPANTFTVYPP
jgi:hypothetical protein